MCFVLDFARERSEKKMQILLFRMSSFCSFALPMPRPSDKNKTKRYNTNDGNSRWGEKNGPHPPLETRVHTREPTVFCVRNCCPNEHQHIHLLNSTNQTEPNELERHNLILFAPLFCAHNTLLSTSFDSTARHHRVAYINENVLKQTHRPMHRGHSQS